MMRTTADQVIKKFSNSTGMCKRLQGRVAIVTASTQGIGFSIAKRLAQEGAKVMISSRREENVNNAVQLLSKEGLQVSGVVCHVGKQQDRQKLLDETKAKFGGLDILVSNAAVNPSVGPVLDTSEDVWDKIFDINVKSTYLLMKEARPLLKQGKSPSIIIVASIAAYQPFDLLGVYSLSKTALVALCKATYEDLSRDGIRVNCIAPGVIKTKFSQAMYQSEEIENATKSRIAMGRLGLPDEMGGIAAFLASDDASYITGESIIASGGMPSRL